MKSYDRAYFDRWYHDPATRVSRPRAVARDVAMLVGLTEYFLGRPLQRVLDVGCGEGHWRAPLRRLRPNIHYLGLDSSTYAVERYGRARNIHRMHFSQLAEQRFEAPFDLLICANLLQYLDAAEIHCGLSGVADILHGVAYLETYVRGDQVEGDHEDFKRRNAAWYRAAFARAGLVPCGPHAWLSEACAADLPTMALPDN